MCFRTLIIPFIFEYWDIEINCRFTNVNSLLNSYSKKCSHPLQTRNSHIKVYFSSSFWRLLQEKSVLVKQLFYLLPNVEIFKWIVDLQTLTHYWTHIRKSVLIRCKQRIVIEKYISHRHFEDFAGKLCSYEKIILFTSKCWDI